VPRFSRMQVKGWHESLAIHVARRGCQRRGSVGRKSIGSDKSINKQVVVLVVSDDRNDHGVDDILS
jgi:hypothetical protein